MPALPPRRATYKPKKEEDEGARARSSAYAGKGKLYTKAPERPNFLERLMAYAKARANQEVFIRPGPGGLGPASPANQPGRSTMAGGSPAQARAAAYQGKGYGTPGPRFTSTKGPAIARPYAYATGRGLPLYTQRKRNTPDQLDYPSEAEIAAAKMYRPPEVMAGGGGGAGGAGYPGYGGYGGYGGYPYYGGGGYGGGGGGRSNNYRGPAYYGNEPTPSYPTYQRPNIPAWLQALVTWNIGG